MALYILLTKFDIKSDLQKVFQIFDHHMNTATNYLINENINFEIPKFKDNS